MSAKTKLFTTISNKKNSGAKRIKHIALVVERKKKQQKTKRRVEPRKVDIGERQVKTIVSPVERNTLKTKRKYDKKLKIFKKEKGTKKNEEMNETKQGK